MSYAKRYRFMMLLSVVLLMSCTKAETYYTREEMQFKTDSIIRSRITQLEQAAKEDLNRRLPIELKVKLDSIFQVSYDIPPPPRLGVGADSGAVSGSPETLPGDHNTGL